MNFETVGGDLNRLALIKGETVKDHSLVPPLREILWVVLLFASTLMVFAG